jgi:hypothetical protein
MGHPKMLDLGVKSKLVEPPGKVWQDLQGAVCLVILVQSSISVLQVRLKL